jgi:hypothetical protein
MPYSLLRMRAVLLTAAAFVVVPTITGCGGSSAFAPSLPSTRSQFASPAVGARPSRWKFSTINNPSDPRFNELLAIDNLGKICGFYGNGTKKHPSDGYCVSKLGQSNFRPQNYPNALDTYVTSLNNNKVYAGYYRSAHGGIFGFTVTNGIWTSYKDPRLRGTSPLTELLGISDANLAVGFYTDQGVNHAFELNVTTGQFQHILPPGGVSVEATGINGKGDIVGYMTTSRGATKSFLLKGGVYTMFSHPGSSVTQATSLNWQDQIGGSFVKHGRTHGFLVTGLPVSMQWKDVNDPDAAGTTVVTSVENHGYMVGWYVDSAGKTNGFLAAPVK